jgi:hypothetical protein
MEEQCDPAIRIAGRLFFRFTCFGLLAAIKQYNNGKA